MDGIALLKALVQPLSRCTGSNEIPGVGIRGLFSCVGIGKKAGSLRNSHVTCNKSITTCPVSVALDLE